LKRQKRAMVMIVVVILIAAITTIIAASVDLSRMAVYKQNQAEREAKWQYCVDSAKAMVVEDMVGLVGTTQSFSKTVNGIDLAIGATPDLGWNPYTSSQISVKGNLEGNIRLTTVYAGKRSTVQPCQFGLYFTDIFDPDSLIDLTGDAYLARSINASQLLIAGDIYCPDAAGPKVAGQTGSYIGRQPGQKIALDDSTYASKATITTSGTMTLKNPTNLLSLSQSELRFHKGHLTITGSTTGEITVYVQGSVTIKNITNSVMILGRLVVICNGDAQIENGVSDVFLICNGKISSSKASGTRTINGSLAGIEFSNTTSGYTIKFDNYFVANPDGGFRYWLPGQW